MVSRAIVFFTSAVMGFVRTVQGCMGDLSLEHSPRVPSQGTLTRTVWFRVISFQG